jgi:hypothetical protein
VIGNSFVDKGLRVDGSGEVQVQVGALGHLLKKGLECERVRLVRLCGLERSHCPRLAWCPPVLFQGAGCVCILRDRRRTRACAQQDAERQTRDIPRR